MARVRFEDVDLLGALSRIVDSLYFSLLPYLATCSSSASLDIVSKVWSNIF